MTLEAGGASTGIRQQYHGRAGAGACRLQLNISSLHIPQVEENYEAWHAAIAIALEWNKVDNTTVSACWDQNSTLWVHLQVVLEDPSMTLRWILQLKPVGRALAERGQPRAR